MSVSRSRPTIARTPPFFASRSPITSEGIVPYRGTPGNPAQPPDVRDEPAQPPTSEPGSSGRNADRRPRNRDGIPTGNRRAGRLPSAHDPAARTGPDDRVWLLAGVAGWFVLSLDTSWTTTGRGGAYACGGPRARRPHPGCLVWTTRQDKFWTSDWTNLDNQTITHRHRRDGVGQARVLPGGRPGSARSTRPACRNTIPREPDRPGAESSRATP